MSLEIWTYSIISVFIVSFVSLVGVFTLSLSDKNLKKVLLYLVSFSAGALLGDAFIHLLPQAVEMNGFSLGVSFAILLGILFSFVVEAFLQWIHCHLPSSKRHKHTFVYMNLLGDAAHNFLDGLIIGASYIVSIPVGVATTIAVVFHEIPQEIGDFGVLVHGGFSKGKAIFYNFLTALTSVLGVILSLLLAQRLEGFTSFFVPFAAGGFIYIAGSDLIPELHKGELNSFRSFLQLVCLFAGILVMVALLFLE
ncbi:ZIP family metal transporter [Candidatus Woesearchaeota archaeon]|nr:ZIP family metal transporter [Candidatus Woesearchaeota archaeon]